MTDRLNKDVAYDGFMKAPSGRTRYRIEKALDAIHPALAHLTPDDVRAIFRFAVADGPWDAVPVHAWEVLSRD